MRLSVERIHVLLAKGSLLVTAAAMVASIVMVAVGCDARRPWTQVESECTGLVSNSHARRRFTLILKA